jgi:hypothetical protein
MEKEELTTVLFQAQVFLGRFTSLKDMKEQARKHFRLSSGCAVFVRNSKIVTKNGSEFF